MIDEMTPIKDETTRKEEFKVTSEMLMTKIKELVHEGNVRRIVVKNEAGQVIAEFPMTAGVVGAILLPVWAAICAIAALAAELTIVVERRD
jgi:DNA-binding HxlR family transcriptional regulator